MNVGITIANDGVQLIGSGTDFVYDNGRFRAPVDGNLSGTVLAAAGLAPVITNVNVNGDSVRVTGADALIGGITVDAAARHGIYALSSAGTNLGDITIHDITATNNGQSGVLIESGNAGSGFSSATVRDVTATGNTNRGVYALIQNGSTMDTLTISDVVAANNNGVTTGGMVVTVSGAGARLNHAVIRDSTVSNNITGGLIVQAANSGILDTVDITGITAAGNGGVGVYAISQLTGLIDTLNFEDITASANADRGVYVISQTDGDMDTVTLNDIVSMNNTGASGLGMEITATGAGSTIFNASVTDATISGNAQQGALVQATTNATIGIADIENMTSQNNLGANGRGLQFLAGTGSSITSTEITDSVFSGNVSNGLYITPTNGGLFDDITVSNVTTSGNAAQGVLVLAQVGGDINTFTIDGVTSQNNTGGSGRGLHIDINGAGSTIGTAEIRNASLSSNAAHGAYINVQNSGTLTALDMDTVTSNSSTVGGAGVQVDINGAASTLDTATLSNISTTANLGMGTYVNALSGGQLHTVNMNNVSSNGDSSRGIYVIAQTGADIGTVMVDDAEALNIAGAAGRGMEIIASGAGSTIASATVENSTFNNNLNMGLLYQAITSGVITSSTIRGTTASNNTGLGIEVLAQIAGSMNDVTIEDITANGNAGRGVYVFAQTDGDIA
ncbi:MAG TPA: hypothetical protein VIG74_00685, partial [Alphaproteobacteria bacterium]